MKLFVDSRMVSQGVYEVLRAFFREEFDIEKIEALNRDQGFFAAIWHDDESDELCVEIDRKERACLRLVVTDPDFESREYKLKQRQLMYQAARKLTGRDLPWGILTGIRPTKIIAQERAKGRGDKEIAERLQSVFFVSQEKTDLVFLVDEIEKPILDAVQLDSYSLYVGIPFCPTRCSYCSFPSYARNKHEDWVAPYLEKLHEEVKETARLYQGWKLSSVYIGGGTPTALKADELRALIRVIRKAFSVHESVEFTVEAGRPDTLNEEMFNMLKAEGITRISINPQTMKDETLERIGRSHKSNQVVEVFRLAREKGFEEINMDLIVGLPGETPLDFKQTLKRIGELSPDQVTVHSLAVKRASSLGERDYRHKEEQVWEGIDQLLYGFAEEAGYVPYYLYRQKNIVGNMENVGFTRPNRVNLYNTLIMSDRQTIAACGVGAVSKFVYPDHIERVGNPKSIPTYLEGLHRRMEKKANCLTKFQEYDINTEKYIVGNEEDE